MHALIDQHLDITKCASVQDPDLLNLVKQQVRKLQSSCMCVCNDDSTGYGEISRPRELQLLLASERYGHDAPQVHIQPCKAQNHGKFSLAHFFSSIAHSCRNESMRGVSLEMSCSESVFCWSACYRLSSVLNGTIRVGRAYIHCLSR